MDTLYPAIALCTSLAWLVTLTIGCRGGASKSWWPGFAVFGLGMALWNTGYFLQVTFPEPGVAFITQLLIDVSILITIAGSIHFAVSLTQPCTGWRAAVAASAYVVSMAIFVTGRIPALPTTVPFLDLHWPQVTFIYAMVTFAVMLGLETVQLRRVETDLDRHRIKYVILATAIAICAHMAEFTFETGIPTWSLGNVTVMFCGALVVYAMTDDRIVPISAMFRNARHAWTIVVLVTVGYVVFLMTGTDSSVQPWLVLVPVSVIVPLYALFVSRNAIFGMIERIFFTEQHKMRHAINSFETDLASISSPSDMATRLLAVFTDKLNIADALIIASEEIEQLFVGSDSAEPVDSVRGEHVYALREVRLLKLLELVRGPVRREDLLDATWGDDLGIVFDKSAIEKAMNRMHCELLLPLLAGERLLGALGLGKKVSGDVYSDNDVCALRELSNHVGLYLENARIGYRAEQADKMNLLSAMADRIVDRLRNRIEILRDTVEPLATDTRPDEDAIETLRREMAHVHDIIDALRRFARPPDGRFIRCDTNRVVRDALTNYHWETWFEQVTIVTELEDDMPDTFVDPAQIGHAIEAVLLNACESITERSGEVTITTTSHMNSTSPHVRIDVSDSGPGVKPEVMNKIFEPMYTTKDNHTGVGLSVAYSILKQNGCSISVSNVSEEGGALFTIRCPVWGRPVNTND